MVALLAAGFLGVSNSACVDINGGAAELSWALRDAAGNPRNCAEFEIDEIHLFWQSKQAWDSAAPDQRWMPEGQQHFDCEAMRGITDFAIATGEQLFWIEPTCRTTGTAAASGTYIVPPPILREIPAGVVITLNALLVVVLETCTPAANPAAIAAQPAGQ